MASATIFSSASAVDGSVNRGQSGGVDENWGTIRSGAGTSANVGSGGFFCGWNGSGTVNQFSRLDRAIAMFDTSSLGVGAVVTACDLGLYHTTKTTPSDATANKLAVHIVSSTCASPATIVSTDYGSNGSTSFVNIAFASLTGSAYNTFTLDANGIANINVNGFSKFGIITGADILNSAPTTTGSGDLMRVRFEAHNDTNIPKLTITYTLPSFKGSFLLNLI